MAGDKEAEAVIHMVVRTNTDDRRAIQASNSATTCRKAMRFTGFDM